MIVRAAVADDCAGVVAIARQFPYLTPTAAAVEALFDESCSVGGMFVAEHDEGIVGFLCALRQPHPYTERDYIFVVAWWVPVEHRGTGAGLALVRAFARWCSTQAVDLITISAPLSSHLGTVLRDHGFRPVETVWMKGTSWR